MTDVIMSACDVCSSWRRPDLCLGVLGVSSSTLGAFSVSRCRIVLTHGFEPRWAFEALLGTSEPDHAAAWRNGLAGWAVETAESCLACYEVSEEEFVAGIVDAGRTEEALLASSDAGPVSELVDGEEF